MTFGGLIARSNTCTKFSGSQFVGLSGSVLNELAISASVRSGVIAILEGGPITELGILVKCWTAGGNLLKSRMEIESGLSGVITFATPEVSSILASLPEMTICADAPRSAQSSAKIVVKDTCMGPLT